MGNNYPCPDCCVGTECLECGDCFCEDCNCQDTGTGTGFTNAPCCFRVVISGVEEDGCAGSDCESTFNGTFYLSQGFRNEDEVETGTGTGTSIIDPSCTWQHFLTTNCDEVEICSAHKIQLSITRRNAESGTGDDEYFLRIEFGDHVWEKNYGTDPPDCCDIGIVGGIPVGESIPHSATAADCDSSGSTCLVTAWFEGCGKESCEAFVEGPVPCCFLLQTSGVTQEDSGATDCRHCSCINDTDIYLHKIATCVWQLQGPFPCGSPTRLEFSKVGDKYRVTIDTENNWDIIQEYDEKPRVDEWVGEIIDVVSVEGDSDCDYYDGAGTAGVPIAVTPIYNFPEASCVAPTIGGCTRCLCNPDPTPNLKIVVAGVVDDPCDWCDEANGTFILNKTGTNCDWRYTFGVLEGGSCSDGTALWVAEIELSNPNRFTVTFTRGGSSFAFEYVNSPGSELFDCENLNLSMSIFDTTTSCDTSSATCTLTTA